MVRDHPLTHDHQATCLRCIALYGSPTPRPRPAEPGPRVRQFDTGATRDSEDGKLPYGFDSPLVDRRYAEYMQSHRLQSDGELRDPDNWTNGMDRQVYMNSLHRHYQDLRLLWAIHLPVKKEGVDIEAHLEKLSNPDVDIETALCAILFNVKGMLFEVLNGR